ncbi:MAG: hypothetical protein QOJ97_1032 [Solirubrobacteraceae bacterium]|jgi:uncharacterized phage-associated protein|nr:hypothetical protein [Solirubrobacteraceae bacterium]
MASVHDIAAYILRKQGSMSTWKLQKLVYYSQAWHLAWDEQPLFQARIEAWANGPVVPELYRRHRGSFTVERWPVGDPKALTKEERDTVDAVLNGYGRHSGRQLSHLTHAEAPWRDARRDLAPTDRSTQVISPESMQAFYTALDTDENAEPVDTLKF